MKAAGRIAFFYLLFGYLWIYFSDYAISLIFASVEDIREFQSLKGWGFVTLSAAIIFVLLVRELRRQKRVLFEKIESDQLFQVILERIEDAVIVFNLDTWKIDFLSEQVSRLFDIPTKDILTHPQLLIERVHELDRDRMTNIWMNQLRENHTGLLYRIRKLDGHISWALEHRLFIPSNEGSANKAVAVITDMTSYMENQSKLERSLKENETLLTEVHHRVKNNLAVVISFLQLQVYSSPPETADILEQSIVRIKAIALVHEKLYSSKNLSGLSSVDYITSLVENIKLMYMRTDINIELQIQKLEFNIVDAIPMGLMITEMLTNSFRHAFVGGKPDALIKIDFLVKDNFNYELKYRDNGVGFPPELNYRKAESIGLSVIFSLCSQMNGREVECSSKPNEGVFYHFAFSPKKVILKENSNVPKG
ncbi:sensor histidine kinase [Leptospira kanakyensis]|uniref:histidine kinase n=1 Tax=Leptospira kanakyensis TaxID=2484968 RepID=A0A6N4PS05_9LEPT|nr:histidine kinase dimerization/phosphoacceptor domain -containing protein [Leptospira kanakyensis]MCW7471592.1 PAS domain-containing protein [Leptospira kanakyensis]MCW7481244.1 PAS domain-containing protein [Leptospira kanakyensis]TGK46120.1 histidine kinase [Leptospira kanakyensis]TGK65057.1 histidine kinase [Leptospira kanakyensis]TGK65489.1 histidine kinase [Leptospira kanakyensis]